MPEIESIAERDAAAGRYLKIVFVSLAATLAVVLVLVLAVFAKGTLPPPPLTGNLSFDEKALFVRRALNQRYDVLVAGSSLALNDVSSDELAQDEPNHPRVLNISAWGLSIEDSRRWLNHVLEFIHPKTVIMVMAIPDFEQGGGALNATDRELDSFFSNGPDLYLLLIRKFSFMYYLKNFQMVNNERSDRTDYKSLQFDGGGGVALDMAYPRVDMVRWNTKLKTEALSAEQYRSLSVMASDLRAKSIDLVGVATPMRSAAFEQDPAGIERHWLRVGTILRDSGQHFINLQEQLRLDDSNFADYAHLNSKGAARFTKELAEKLSAESR